MKIIFIDFCVCLIFGNYVDASKIPLALPTPDTIFSVGKNVLATYPVEAVFNAIKMFSSRSQNQVKPNVLPDLSQMNYLLKTRTGDHLIPIQSPEKLWNHPAFNRDLNTAILVTGWFSNNNSTMANDALDTVWEAYKCRGGVNFVVIDTAAFIDTLYTWSTFNTEEIGIIIAKGLVDLMKMYPLEKIHLIGHSLGADISGATGRHFTKSTSIRIGRITGLDPAGPIFYRSKSLAGLSRGDAVFVDVIHSNSDVLSKEEPVGDVDFFDANGVSSLPQGCFNIICSHHRAWELYAKTVYPGNENALMASECSSMTALNSGSCPGKRVPMGYAVPNSVKGNYFIETERHSLLGLQAKKDSKIVCGH